MPPTQTTATDITGGSGVTVPQPDLRDPQFRQADTDDTTPPAPPEPHRTAEFQFTAEQIEKARREEREKVQREKARLKELADQQKAELEELRQFREAKQAEEEQRRKKAEREQRKEAEKDLSAKEILAIREQEWEARAQAMEHKFAQLEAKAKLERAVMELQVYIQRRVNEERDAIADEFIDYIDGTSPEEVEASIERAKQKTAAIAAKVSAIGTPGATATRGVSVSSGPAALPSDLGGMQQTGDEVDYKNMSLKEYLESVRPKLGIGGGGKGLFD